jgi:hypothetical protein
MLSKRFDGVASLSRSGPQLDRRQVYFSRVHNPNEEGPWQTR